MNPLWKHSGGNTFYTDGSKFVSSYYLLYFNLIKDMYLMGCNLTNRCHKTDDLMLTSEKIKKVQSD